MPSRSISVLVIDDDPQIRRSVCRVLERHGYQALEVATDRAALAVAASAAPIDLVVSDVEMPGLGGFELVAALRERRAGLRVLFMSGGVTTSPDGTPVVAKPFTEGELVAAIGRSLSG